MTNLISAGKTPAHVAKIATEKADFTGTQTALIGLYGPAQDMRALVRDQGGRIRKVKRGNRVSGGLVVGIDAQGLMIQQSGQVRRLQLPPS